MIKCDQCNYLNQTEKGLGMHVRKNHRRSPVDGIYDLHKENPDYTDIVTLELHAFGGIIGPHLPTLPPSNVLHPKACIGHLQKKYSRRSDGDTFVSYKFDNDPKAITLYDVFLL